MKKVIFYTIMLMPIMSIPVIITYFFFFTNLPQLLYARSIRNIYFDCITFSLDSYVYKMKLGPCRVDNIEYNILLTHDADGFRNRDRTSRDYDIAVIGDSHAHGVGVQDDETFSRILESKFHFLTLNLAIGSYATMRELEVLTKYGADAKYVVVQYCDNDGAENAASLQLSKEDFRSQVETTWKGISGNYFQGKSLGYKKPIYDVVQMIKTHAFISKSAWQNKKEWRQMEQEASSFAQILARYRPLLEGKRLIILEVASWGANSPKFEATFGAELSKVGWLRYKLINTASVLDLGDYFFLDDHINAAGHRKLAAAINNEIARWERIEPLIQNQ